MRFSQICNSVIPYPIGTTFATEVQFGKGSLHTTFEENCFRHFRDTSDQNFILISSFFLLYFAHFAKSAIKHECVFQSS